MGERPKRAIRVVALARALRISATAAYKLLARGMPGDDVSAARRWRARNLRPRALAAAGGRIVPLDPAINPADPRSVSAFGQRIDLSGPDARYHVELLREVFLDLPEAAQLEVVLPVQVWAALVGDRLPAQGTEGGAG